MGWFVAVKTLAMTFVSGFFCQDGLPVGVLLYVTRPGKLLLTRLYRTISAIVNIRSDRGSLSRCMG